MILFILSVYRTDPNSTEHVFMFAVSILLVGRKWIWLKFQDMSDQRFYPPNSKSNCTPVSKLEHGLDTSVFCYAHAEASSPTLIYDLKSSCCSI
jgi:hypothetical protein